MRVLVCGANGFVGSAIVNALSNAGLNCIRGVRKPVGVDDMGINYLEATNLDYWHERLAGIDVVINAVGVLRDSAKTPMSILHEEAAGILFQACAQKGVSRIVNISALGVDSSLETKYFQTKKAAEDILFSLPNKVATLNLRPSVIYGEKAASAKMFRLQASMPIHFLPMGGTQVMQPVHIQDIATAIIYWLKAEQVKNLCIDAVGNEVVTMREMLDSYRHQQGKGKAWHIPVPGFLVRMAAAIGDYLPFSPLSTDTLAMLQFGSTGNKDQFRELLTNPPKGASTFIQ